MTAIVVVVAVNELLVRKFEVVVVLRADLYFDGGSHHEDVAAGAFLGVVDHFDELLPGNRDRHLSQLVLD